MSPLNSVSVADLPDLEVATADEWWKMKQTITLS